MKKMMRSALVMQALVLATGVQATVFDQPGTYVQYMFSGLRADAVTQNSTQWVYASGATASPSWLPAGVGQASIAAQAGVGIAKLSLSASGDGFAPLAWAGWTDQIVVNAPDQAGTHGTVSFQIRYDWTASANANPGGQAYAGAYLDVNFRALSGGTSQYADVTQSLLHDCSETCELTDTWYAEGVNTAKPTFADGLATFSLNVVFGQAYSLTIAMNASLPGMNGSASVDATHTVLWNGVQTVTGAGGQTLADYSVTSAIGLDYKNVVSDVPEPATLLLLTAGLAVIAARRRRS